MSFNYNGVSPTEINYNGTSIDVLTYNGVNIWGKPYTLSISQDVNTTISVTRISSPNQNAATGNLTNGSTIYYGDVLQINASANSGYNLSSFIVNNSNWTSGNTITVTSAISITTTAVVSASWHTVWTGSNSIPTTAGGNTTATTYTHTGFSGMQTGYKTRISGYFGWYEEVSKWTPTDLEFTLELGNYKYQNTLNTTGTASDFSISTSFPPSNYCYFGPYSISPTAIGWRLKTGYQESDLYWIYNYNHTLTVTKIEQYY